MNEDNKAQDEDVKTDQPLVPDKPEKSVVNKKAAKKKAAKKKTAKKKAAKAPAPCSVEISLSRGASAPSQATSGSAGYDLCAIVPRKTPLQNGQTLAVSTGLSVAIPEGYCGIIVARSGLGTKGVILANGTGVIDSDFRGEIVLQLLNRGREVMFLQPDMRVAQLLIVPVVTVEFKEVEELPPSERGIGGFGSTDS